MDSPESTTGLLSEKRSASSTPTPNRVQQLLPRRRTLFFTLTTAALIYLATMYVSRNSTEPPSLSSVLSRNPSCPIDRWAAGNWAVRPGEHPNTMSSHDDVYALAGFTGCNGTYHKHEFLSLPKNGQEEWSWRAQVGIYDWQPHSSCRMSTFDKKDFVTRLVRNGGWAIVGDQAAETQFFSLTCMLHPYVRATPVYWEGWGFKATWNHYLYLNTDEEFVRNLSTIVAPNFDVGATPLVSYTRSDVLFDEKELADLMQVALGVKPRNPLSPEAFWETKYSFETDKTEEIKIITRPMEAWLDEFTAKIPAGRYDTLILNSGAYWMKGVFAELKGGMDEILLLWRVAMSLLTTRMVRVLDQDITRKKVVIFRSAMVGHRGCTTLSEMRTNGPVTHAPDVPEGVYNWKWIPHMNDIVEEIIQSHRHPRMQFLRLDRPGSLRPDAHLFEDCLQFTVGAGIIEDWNRYIDHFLQWEVDYSKR